MAADPQQPADAAGAAARRRAAGRAVRARHRPSPTPRPRTPPRRAAVRRRSRRRTSRRRRRSGSPNPRKRGPILFWFTLALIALSEGLLGIADLAGADVADPAYPALAVAICGVMLLVGAFFGRAGGIILIGLVATVGLVGATAVDRVGRRRGHRDADDAPRRSTTATGSTPASRSSTCATSPTSSSLDGRTLEVEGGVGRIEVILPDGLAATVDADVDGPGNIDLFGDEHGGIDVTESSFDGSSADPEITINAQLGVGQIEVHR